MKDINEELGLPVDYKIGINDAFQILSRFKEATFGSDKKISMISFIYYKDKFGNFLEPKNHFNKIVKDMFDNLDNSTKFELLTFFNTD